MIGSGSTEGSDACSSLVATSFTQSVEPGSGTRSTLMPSFSNQPSLLAMAKGAAAELIVLAHQPTRMVCTWALAVPEEAATARAKMRATQAIGRISKLLPWLYLSRLHRHRATYPRTAPGDAPA